jgi:hypothetical protein
VRNAGCVTATAVAFLAACGCAARRPSLQSFRVLKEPSGTVLVPPGISDRKISQSSFKIVFPAGSNPCHPESSVIAIHRRGARLEFSVPPEALSKQPQGWLAEWAAGLEQSGCIPKGAAPHVAAQVAESVPLGLNTARGLLHPNNIQTGVVDLTGAMRIEVVSPILNQGTPPDAPILIEGEKTTGEGVKINVTMSSPNLIGYETAWYAIGSRPNGHGLAISPQYAERHIDGQTELRDQPATNYLRFPSDAAFYRLFYKSGETDYTAIVLAAHNWPELNQSTKVLADGSCNKLASKLCIAIPKRVAINPFISVKVNDADVVIPWGSTLAQAIRQSGQPRPSAVLAHLCLQRPYKGRLLRVEFDRNDPAILSMILNGGEVVSWKVSMARLSATHEFARR